MSVEHLPNAISAVAADAKFRDYLLNANHPMNGGKAAFFQRFGFSQGSWSILQDAILDHPKSNLVSGINRTAWGDTFEVVCNCRSPDGRDPCITSIWVVEPTSPNPRFVTAYPGS
jgi:hypothetical protein